MMGLRPSQQAMQTDQYKKIGRGPDSYVTVILRLSRETSKFHGCTKLNSEDLRELPEDGIAEMNLLAAVI